MTTMDRRLPPLPVTAVPRTSSRLSAQYSTATLFGRVAVDPTAADPVNIPEWYDPLDPKIAKIISEAAVTDYYVYDYQEPITSIASKKTGTTSTWWIILQFNGFLHPDEITPGTTLRIPDLRAVTTSLNKLLAKRGIVVSF